MATTPQFPATVAGYRNNYRSVSDIEHSIQNAVARLDFKNLDFGNVQHYVIDDPIVSLHNFISLLTRDITTSSLMESKKICPERKIENSNSSVPKTNKNSSSPGNHLETDENELFYDAVPSIGTKMSQESTSSHFLEDPVRNTIEEIHRVLNAKTDKISPRIHSRGLQQPSSPPLQQSPEEILNIYSQDLGINCSPVVSPRVGIYQNLNTNEYPKIKEIKEKNSSKKHKPIKLKKENKLETGKRKSVKSDSMTTQDTKMRELMNIYGCGDKMKKPKSDSTIGSKSGVSRNASMRKLSGVNIASSKASIAVSRKSKKLKYKITNDLDINLNEGDSAPIEKSSRLGTKRKNKPKPSSIKPIKKPNLKRKLVSKQNVDDDNLKLDKNPQTYTRIKKVETQQIKGKHCDEYYNDPRKQTNLKPANHNPRENLNLRKRSSVKDAEVNGKSDGFTILDAIPNAKELSDKNTSVTTEGLDEKLCTLPNKHTQIIDTTEKDQNILSKKVSEEKRLNKQVSLRDGVHYHDYTTENKENNDFGNVVEHPTQFHYTLPTQSSRSKEVERILSGHYQHLPFVIGQSTNKSHNLWVNIQEALFLIKQNIPQPMEIHSVYKDGDKDSERPLTVLSKLSTTCSKKPHQCPALMHDGLYDIPETSVEGEEGVKWEDHPDCVQANLDSNFYRPRCSCVPQGTLSYKKVLQQIFAGGEDSMERPKDEILDQGGDTYLGELRKVLIAFTEEFEDLNNQYEKFLPDPESSKEELQRLEMCLETKEEQIREIIARINEMKELHDRSRGPSLEAYRSTTSVQLRQTLRRVQQFKEDIRSKPTSRHWSRISCAKSFY